jgi:hypothetical protein
MIWGLVALLSGFFAPAARSWQEVVKRFLKMGVAGLGG